MITKDIATSLTHGQILHHVSFTNADGTPVRVRVNGVCKTWKTRPTEFRLPVKYGLKDCLYITPENANNWVTASRAQTQYQAKSRSDLKFWPEKIVRGLKVSWMVVAAVDGEPATEAHDDWFANYKDADEVAKQLAAEA